VITNGFDWSYINK